MTTLVTGAGLVGVNFARCAIARGEKVVFLDPAPRGDFLKFKLGADGYSLMPGDVRNLAEILDAVRQHNVDTIVHTAGVIGSKAQRNISMSFDINVIGTRNAAEAARLTGIKRLVHMSTMGVYDTRRPSSGPMKETFYRGPGTAYGNQKVEKELLLEYYSKAFDFEVMILRLANVFGFGHFWAGSGGGQKINALVRSHFTGQKAQLRMPDTIDSEYIYEKDVGEAIDKAATIAMPGENIINIADGNLVKFDDLVSAVKEALPGADYELEPGAPPEMKSNPMDIERARQVLGWQAKFTLVDAFKAYREEVERANAKGLQFIA